VRVKSAKPRDLIAGSVLLTVALVWIILVYKTIDPSQGPEAGPRAFPLFFGAVLAVLSVILLAQSVMSNADGEPPETKRTGPSELFSLVATITSLVVYGVLLEPLGFLPSTALVVAAMMIFILRVSSPVLVAGMSIGLPLGCYIVFGKLLGTYLPPGTLITIYL